MTDARLREVERAASCTGAVDDEARVLVERVRAGDLPRDRLDLAAHCGHEASRAALGLGETLLPWDAPTLLEWFAGLAPSGAGTLAFASTELLWPDVMALPDELPGYHDDETWEAGPPLRAALAAVRARTGVTEALAALDDAEYADVLRVRTRGCFVEPPPQPTWVDVGQSVRWLAASVVADWPDGTPDIERYARGIAVAAGRVSAARIAGLPPAVAAWALRVR